MTGKDATHAMGAGIALETKAAVSLSLTIHEAFCKNASILAEALHQQHVVNAPRVLPGTKRPRTKAAAGRGRGRGRKN